MNAEANTALRDLCSSIDALRPPKRVTVADGAASSLLLKRPGDAPTAWSAKDTPYMVEPMNTLSSRQHSSTCFVGPAQCGKTVSLGEGWMAHAIANDPGDMLIVQMTESKAREYSRQRIDRALDHSPKLSVFKSSLTDNLHDKMFKHGMWLRIGWPTITNLSSTSYRYVFLTDYDRMPEDVDGEGDAFSLALKRTTTFLSRGMCAVESSPGFPVVDPNWQPSTHHEAPPCGGVLGIYNTSDRRRWYWKCLDCKNWFEAKPGLSLFRLPSEEQLLEEIREINIGAMAKEYARVICPHCETKIPFSYRYSMNQAGRWLPDGCRLRSDDTVEGDAMQSTTAGFWLGGVAAAYQSWESLLSKYLQALRHYALTSDESHLQTTVNTDQGMPYISWHLRQAALAASDPGSRREQDMQRYVVPIAARFLIATVDIQGGVGARFVVQVHAIGPNREKWLIDRYAITESNREGLGGKAPVDPAGYAEDWDLITEKVVRCTYRTEIENIEMRVRLTVVDTGGEDGVTERAYAWYRRLVAANVGMRVMLVKGQSSKKFEAATPNIRMSKVGARNPKEEGDIPLYILNTDRLKDIVSTDLKRSTPGAGYLHIPAWLPQSFLDELNSEVRNPDGTWTQVRKRNEAFDLLAYCEAGFLCLGADKINWQNPPAWAKTIESNVDSMTRADRKEMQENTPVAQTVATPEPEPVSRSLGRRVARSNYLA